MKNRDFQRVDIFHEACYTNAVHSDVEPRKEITQLLFRNDARLFMESVLEATPNTERLWLTQGTIVALVHHDAYASVCTFHCLHNVQS